MINVEKDYRGVDLGKLTKSSFEMVRMSEFAPIEMSDLRTDLRTSSKPLLINNLIVSPPVLWDIKVLRM